MPAPSRDRLPRPVDISTLFPRAARRVNLIVDEPGLRWAGLSGNSTRVRGGVGAHRLGLRHRRNYQSLPPVVGWENRAPMTLARHGGGRGRASVLPNWHPRTPLRDITGIVRALESRRAELQVDQPVQPSPENTTDEPSVAGAQPEHREVGASTPLPTIMMKPRPSPLTEAMKILKENRENAGFLTPEKQLLNSIEKVREVWLKEQRKLERTPAAKKAERERKVKTLMSMR